MTPAAFIAKWRASPKREHIDSQPHFLDLCRLLGIDDPATADPAHTWFTGASKTSGGQGWADVLRKGCFDWEYKSYSKPLEPAFRQLLNYTVALENPPLLIVSDMNQGPTPCRKSTRSSSTTCSTARIATCCAPPSTTPDG